MTIGRWSVLVLILATTAVHSGEAPAYPDHTRLMEWREPSGNARPVRTPADWSIRREHLLASLQQVMGPLPARDRSSPPAFRVLAEESTPRYVRKKIQYVAEPDDAVPAWLLVPKEAPAQLRSPDGKLPAMLCLHQTTKIGKDEPAGLGGLPNLHYGHELAERGMVCLIPDYPSFGEYPYDFQTKGSSYASGSMKAIWNNLVGVDLLTSLPEVDPARLGVIGHSLGGHNALFTATFDPRLKVVVSSCGYTPFHDYDGGKVAGWTSDRYMPRIRDVHHNNADEIPFDFPEIVAGLAPRAFFSNSPVGDGNFDIAGVRRCIDQARAIYRLHDADARLVLATPDVGHDFPADVREQAYTFVVSQLAAPGSSAASKATARVYDNRLIPIADPKPLLADYPEFFEPIREQAHFEASAIVNDDHADLHVRAWRFSYNARGIIEMPNHLRADRTAVIMVHPWGIDDGQGWITPEPAGVADFCTKEKNHLAGRHTREIVRPFLNALRGKAAFVMYSLPGPRDPIRHKLYRSFGHRPGEVERREGAEELKAKLTGFRYEGEPLPASLTLSGTTPVIDYFKQFPGLDAGPRYNNAGFWDLPIPVSTDVEVHPDDVVIYDAEGYPALRDFLKRNAIRHVLLTGYATDMCFCKTTAGYENLSKDFNVFLVADASLATFPSNTSPRFAVNAAISFAALNQLVTQVSWVRWDGEKP